MSNMLRPMHMAPGHEAREWTEAVTRQGVDTSLQPSTAHATQRGGGAGQGGGGRISKAPILEAIAQCAPSNVTSDPSSRRVMLCVRAVDETRSMTGGGDCHGRTLAPGADDVIAADVSL